MTTNLALAANLSDLLDTDRAGLRVYLTGPAGVDLYPAARALAALGPAVLTRAELLAEHDDELDGMLACDDALLVAHVLAYVVKPDPVDVTLAHAARVPVLPLRELLELVLD